MSDTVYNISTEYARFPGPRFREDGPNSGEDFRETILAPKLRDAIRRGERLTVVLDGGRGYTASFLEEAFGGLIRKGMFTKQQLAKALEIKATEARVSYWSQRVREYMQSAEPA